MKNPKAIAEIYDFFTTPIRLNVLGDPELTEEDFDLVMKMALWKFTLRQLAITRSDRQPFVEWVVLRGTRTEREAVMKVKSQKFTPDWWDGVLIQEVEYMGEVWHMEAA